MFRPVSKTILMAKLLIHNAGKRRVTRTLPVDPESGRRLDPVLCQAQIDLLVSTPLFQGSETLCKLLQYLTQHALHSPTTHLKEYQIATEALGRAPDFDPQSDASVRVQVGRLRSKLAEYYASRGTQDAILIDIPKGRYALSFERRDTLHERKPPEHEKELLEPESKQMESAPVAHRRRMQVFVSLAVGLVVGGAVFYFLYLKQAQATARQHSEAIPLPVELQTFWSPFLHGSDEPFVIYSNAAFVGDAETGMRYYDQSRDSSAQISQHYTGVGEVMGVVELDRLFSHSGKQFRIKRSGLFTLDDARNRNLIFVGAPIEDLTLREIPNFHDFAFRRMPDGPNRWNEVIVDLHPQSGEDSVYEPTPHSRSLDVDYALIVLSRGLDPQLRTLVLAGTSTIGTQAAVDYVCGEDSIRDLVRQLNVNRGTDVPPFEALLKIKVANDVPIESRLIALHRTGQ